jgi:hypothetical protein
MVITNYVTKWVEAKALITNIAVVIARFLYECILTRVRRHILALESNMEVFLEVIKPLVEVSMLDPKS